MLGKAVDRLFGTDVDDPLPWTRLGTTLAGGLGGAYAGAQIPGPPVVKGVAGALGSIGGTMAGAAAPETVMDFMESSGIVEPGFREKSGLSNEQLMTLVEGEGLLDMYTLGGLSVARGVGRGIARVFTGTTRAGRETAEEAARLNIALMPVQVGERSIARGFVSVLGRFPYVSTTLRNNMTRQMNQFQNAFEGIPARFGPLATYDQASASILRDASGFLDNLNTTYRRQFDQLLQQADFRGVQVAPVRSRSVTEALMKQVNQRTPRSLEGVQAPTTKGDTELKSFLVRTMSKLYSDPELAHQSMRKMNTVLETIDEKMIKLAQTGDADTLQRFERLRNAVMADMTSNAMPRIGQNASPAQRAAATQEARQIIDEFRRLDTELTTTVTDLIGSATGKKLSLAQSSTGRGIRMTSGVQTDSLARSILQGNSPRAVTDLARVVTPDTMREISSSVFREALDHARVPETGRFDMERFAERVGLNDTSSLKYAQTRELLAQSGGLRIEELESMVRIARVASSVEIPDVSVMLARRGTLGGIRAVSNALIPGAIVAGGGAAAGGWAGAALGGLMIIGGAKLLSNMISRPESARALRRVLDTEVRTTVRRAAFMRAVELGLSESGEAVGTMASEEARNTMLNMRDYLNELDRHMQAK